MANNPTVVIGSLNDEELKKSIDKLVNHVDQQLNYMVSSTKVAVMSMNKSLKSLGDTKIDFGGSADGGASKRTKAQEEYTESVKKTTAETKRMGKETEMTFDQIATALSQARRTVSDFNTKRASGMLPSSEDYKKYEQALARIVEYNDKLKQSALAMADANQKAFAFDGKGLVKDFFSVDERLKQLNQHYKEEEKSSQKATAAIKENTQAKKENANVGQPAKSARDSYIAFMQGYKQQAEQIRRLMDEEQKAMQQRRQGVIDGFSKTIEERKARVKELSEEISKLYKERPDGYRDAIKQRTEEMNALKQKIRELTEAQKNLAESPIGASKRYLELEKEYNRIKNIMIDTTNVQRQSTQETEKQAQASKEYSEQVKKIAAEIRESAQWQKSDKFGFKRGMMNLDGRAYPVAENLEMGLRLEDQIVSVLQRANDERQKGIQITQQQAQSSRQVSEEDRKAMEALGWADSQQKRKYTPPMMNIERISEARGALQSITGMQEAWVDSINKTKSSYYQLSDYVKQLKNELIHLPKGVHDEAVKVLIREIQQAEREMQKFQQTMSRPVSLKDALGGSEKTLDDIAYKMRQLASYRSGLNIKTQANEIEQVNRKYAELQKSMNDIMRKNTEMIKSNTAVGRSWNYMKNRLAFYFTVGAGTQFVKNLIEVRSQYEMNERALGILINSAERGTQIFNELSQMALVSPYTLIELSTAAKQLTAYDIAAKDVVDTTRRLADMASAVGIPIERLTYALGQIKAYGYLNSRDARMFANAGIPLVKELADHYTRLEGRLVSTADIYDRIKKKAIDYNDVMQVINKMTDEGGKFFDFQAKMAGTLKVQLANLTLAWNNMLNDIGASEQGTISTGIGLLKELFLEWKNISKMITNLAIGFGIVKVAQLAYYGVVMGTNKAIALEAVLGNRLSKNLRSLASSMNAASMSSTALWVGIATFAAAAVVDILRGNEAMKEFNKTLRENAENTYNDLKKFSENYSGLRESLYKTENGKQTPVDINSEEAKKAWEVLREQIELSSHASDEYIGKLLSIENVSERLRQGFTMIESIQSVSAAIKELGDSSIKLERDWSEWWNLGLLPDGTIGNLQDAYMWLSKIEEKYGSVVNARKVASTSRTAEGFDNVFQEEAKEFVENYETELEKFREDLQVTKQSIIDFIELKGWSGDTSKINEAFKTFTDNLILKNQLNPQQAYTLQLEMEEARSKAAKQALLQRINDERAAYKISHDESVRQALNADIKRYNSWSETNGRSKVEWERFTKWLKEQHISETTAMFRNMDAEDIRSLNFQEGKHAEWVKRMVTQYAKEHKMSYDDAFKYLKNWVRSANQWSIFIPMTISTEDSKTVYKQLGEYDKAVDEADAQIARLTTRINELNAKKKKSKEETKELANAERELTQAQKDKADAEAKGGHGKKEKKDERAANKAAKQAETELQKALKDELSTIDKVRSIYKDLTKEGMSHANAVERATRGWDETVNAINRVLQKNGLQKLDLSKFAGIENPRELVNMLQSQLDTLLKRGAKPAEIKELQTKVNTLEVDADKYDLTKITKGLNNELGKLKDEYELAVELDANPELGGLFVEMFGLDEDALNKLPRTYNQVMKRLQEGINKEFKKNNVSLSFDLSKMLSKEAFDKWVEQNGHLIEDNLMKQLDESRKYAIKVRRDEFKNQTEQWNKLIEKYGEYQSKIRKIDEDVADERYAIIKKYGEDSDIIKGVDLANKIKVSDDPAVVKRLSGELNKLTEEVVNKSGSEKAINLAESVSNYDVRRKAEVDFEEFQHSDYWVAATSQLSDFTNKGLRVLIDSLKEYKKEAKNLDPKKIKQLNDTIRKLEKELKSRNPFTRLADSIKEFKKNSEYGADEIAALEKKINALRDKLNTQREESGFVNLDDLALYKKLNEELKKMKMNYAAIGESNAMREVASSINDILGYAQDVVTIFKAIGDANKNDLGLARAAELAGDIVGNLQASGQGFASGGWIGAIAGGVTDLIPKIVKWINKEDEIDDALKKSAITVTELQNAYKALEEAVEDAFGTAKYGAMQTARANKELQLAELKRQLQLEESRSSKNKDYQAIANLRGQIADLEREIANTTKEIVNDLLGITSVGSFAETLVLSMIEAFRQGEDYMKKYEESFEDMIDNMIMKSIVSKVIGDKIQSLWDEIEKNAEKRGGDIQSEIKRRQAELSQMREVYSKMENDEYGWYEDNGKEISREEAMRNMEKLIAEAEADIARLQKEYGDAISPTPDDVKGFKEKGQDWKDGIKNDLIAFMDAFGIKFGEDDKKKLTGLKQGLQSMSENTAGALEAITNGISQQCYLQSDILIQIRDTVQSFDIDIQTASLSQILLQLQSSYQLQQSMLLTMENWTNPSGNAVRVELIS